MKTEEGIKVRHVDFGLLEEFPRNWMWGNYLVTHFVNSFHLIFPDGEKFFVRSVKAHESIIKDPILKQRVKAFIGQEITHGNEHKKFWNTLEKQGYDIQTFLKKYNDLCYEDLESLTNTYFGKKHSLAVTVALEHFTASLAEFVFKDLKELKGVPEELRIMLLWHASEEIEHKSVAFDVLKEVDSSYLTRMNGLLHGTITLSFFTLMGFFMFMKQELNRGTKIGLDEIFEFINAFISLGRVMFKEILVYMNPDFHPDQVPNNHLAIYFFEKYKVEKEKFEEVSNVK